MKRKLAYAVFAAVMAGGMAVGAAGPASATHCIKEGSPGFSYFGQDGREENDNPPGASQCRKNTRSPSERAPGQS